MAAAAGRTWASRTPSRSAASPFIRKIRTPSTWRRSDISSGPTKSAGSTSRLDGGKTWTKSKYIDADTGFSDVVIDPVESEQRLRRVVPAAADVVGIQRRRAQQRPLEVRRCRQDVDEDSGQRLARAEGQHHRAHRRRRAPRQAVDHLRAHRGRSERRHGRRRCRRRRTGQRGGAAAVVAAAVAGAAAARRLHPIRQRSGVWRSDDAGKTWRVVSNENNRPMYYSQIRVDPANDQKLLVGGASAQMSIDGGREWRPVQRHGHGDYHAFWISPEGSAHRLDRPRRRHRRQLRRRPHVGLPQQHAARAVLPGLGRHAPAVSRLRRAAGQRQLVRAERRAIRQRRGQHRLVQRRRRRRLLHAERSDRLHDHLLRIAERERQPRQPARRIDAQHPSVLGGGGGGGGGGAAAGNITNPPPKSDDFRFNWNAPLELSPHNPATIYYGAQFFFKSTNRGDTWWMNPTDLTKNVDRFANPIMGVAGRAPMASKHDGYANNSNITIIRESPARPGVIWVGTDDGNVHVSQNGGAAFTNVYANITGAPKTESQIARIEPSNFDPGTAYVAIDNHRFDDWKPYLFKTTDYGKTWTPVAGNLPAKGHINAVEEDYVNPNLMFVGTEFGLFVTLDGGKDWKQFMTGLPRVRIDDLLIHPRDADLIVATHGRSFYIADDITPLQQMASRRRGSEGLRSATGRALEERPRGDAGGRRPSSSGARTRRAGPRSASSRHRRARRRSRSATPAVRRSELRRSRRRRASTAGSGICWAMRRSSRRNSRRNSRVRGAAVAVAEAADQRECRSSPAVAAVGFGGGGRGGAAPSGALVAPGTYVVRVALGGQTLRRRSPCSRMCGW